TEHRADQLDGGGRATEHSTGAAPVTEEFRSLLDGPAMEGAHEAATEAARTDRAVHRRACRGVEGRPGVCHVVHARGGGGDREKHGGLPYGYAYRGLGREIGDGTGRPLRPGGALGTLRACGALGTLRALGSPGTLRALGVP